MLGLDSYDPAPKPYRIFSRSTVAKTIAKNKLTMNTMFDREVQRIRDKKDNLRSILTDHQKWLSSIKSDINAYKTMGPQAFAYSGTRMSANTFYPRVDIYGGPI